MRAHWSLRVASVVLLTASACSIDGPRAGEGEAEQDVSERVPRPGDERPDDALPPLPIIAGSEATAYPSAALVNMKMGSTQMSVCSGAVIAPRIVLTAGHCAVGNYDNWDVYVPYAGAQSAHASQALVYDYTDNSGLVNPNQHDVALLVLDSAVTLTTYPEIASSSAAGEQARNIGRIDDGVMSYTRLFVSQALSLSNGNGWGYPYAYVSNEVIQPGDSGGPVVLDGVFPHRIVAVNSGAGGGIQILARVDQLHSWITDQIEIHGGAAPPPSSEPSSCAHESCDEGGALTSACDPCVEQICAQDAYCCTTAWDGVCVGEVASICGLSCDAPPPEPPADPCGGVTFEGECDGATLKWCENEQVSTVDCAQSGKACGWDGANNYYNCG